MDLTCQPDQNSHINVVLCNIVMSRCNKQVQGAIIFLGVSIYGSLEPPCSKLIFTTVDGWNPANQLRLVVYPQYLWGFSTIPGGFLARFQQYVGWLILISPSANLQNLQPGKVFLILCIHSSWKYDMDVKSPGCQIGHNFLIHEII